MLGTLHLMLVRLVMANSSSQDVEQWSEQDLALWFEAGEWKQG